MATQSLVFVALPNGRSASGALRASIYLSPRLDAAPTLADFPDFLDWPDLVQRRGLSFELTCAGSTTTIAAPRPQLRPDLWREIFKPKTHVAAYPTPDFDQRLLVSYPVRTAMEFVQWAYQTAATRSLTGDQRLLSVLLPDLVFRDGRESTLDTVLSEQRVSLWRQQRDGGAAFVPLNLAAAAVPSKPADTREMAERFALYHRMPPAPNSPPLPKTAADFEKTLDFHTALASITAYPSLMRALGLVFDVELPAGFCPQSPASPGAAYGDLTVSKVTPGWSWNTPPTLVTPTTAYTLGVDHFEAAPATDSTSAQTGQYLPSDVVNGFLALSPDLFGMVTVDVDGAMLKAMSLADNYAAVTDRSRVEEVLPSLRSGGLSLIANDRAQELLRSISDNTAFLQAESSGGAPARPLSARDLVRGYRLDIWSSQDGEWRSLHRRDGRYLFGPDGGVVFETHDEEGFTQLAVAQPAPDPTRPEDTVATAAGAPQPSTDIYVHERIARWNGWSLSAPRPGKPLNRSADPAVATDDDPSATEPITPFKMRSTFTARAGSLPRLRYGARYRIRARAVDLAGNSPPLAEQVADAYVLPAGPPAPYFRFEPVPPPVILLRTEPGPGGSLLQMVIRSYNNAPELDHGPTPQTDERHIAPPKAGVLTVEHHGMLDDAQGRMRGDKATYDLVVERDKGVFPAVGQTPIEPAANAVTPYFPDPIARGAAFANLPNTPDDTTGAANGGSLTYHVLSDVQPRPGSVTRVSFGSSWPDRRPFRLILAEGKAPPAWNGVARTLTVSIPKAEVVQVPVSCTLDPPDLILMGVWDWMRAWFEAVEGASMQTLQAGTVVVTVADLRALLTRMVLDGQHEMITPAESLTLVHAVQQPLGRPTWTLLPVTHDPGSAVVVAALRNAFSPITAWRSLGSHHAVLLGGLRIHGKSTARIDLTAQWTEYLDDLHEPGPTTHPAADHVEAIELNSMDQAMVPADGASERFVASYIPQVDTLWFAAPFDSLQGVPSPFQVAAPVHQFGDTKHRRVRYRATAASRFQEYFTEPGLEFTRTSDALSVDVPSSARPAAPEVLYVVPTFGWERQETTNVKTEVREGGGLRVYLSRPWYSSGEGELLGVVIWPQSQPAPDDDARDKFKTSFSQWGLDPIWATGGLQAIPNAFDFPLATATSQNLTLEGISLAVDVAGHKVGYDADRQLWFCDIELFVPDAYSPFVRLALARFQPRSIAGTELSHVVLADFAQLAPHRSAALTVDPADPSRGRLFVGGMAPSGPTRSFIVVSVERRNPAVGTDMGWDPAPAADVTVVEDSPAPSDPTSVLWMGSIVFPAPPPPGRYRIVVREYELLEIDPFEGSIILLGPNYGERLVYASIIPWDFRSP